MYKTSNYRQLQLSQFYNLFLQLSKNKSAVQSLELLKFAVTTDISILQYKHSSEK